MKKGPHDDHRDRDHGKDAKATLFLSRLQVELNAGGCVCRHGWSVPFSC